MIHHCHAFRCETPVPPEKLMCLKHWRMVPKDVQRKIYEHYRPGQCDDKRPSADWFFWASVAVGAVAVREKRMKEVLPMIYRDRYDLYLELKKLKDFPGL